jgi:hypothetical protein
MNHTVYCYYGCKLGWARFKGSGRPRVKADAERLAVLWRRINPHRCYRAHALPVELPSFV